MSDARRSFMLVAPPAIPGEDWFNKPDSFTCERKNYLVHLVFITLLTEQKKPLLMN